MVGYIGYLIMLFFLRGNTMRKQFKYISFMLLSIVLFSFQSVGFAAGPVAMLTEVEGLVEYSKDGEKWKKVRRNKLLKEGYQVRSGADGSVKIIIQSSGKTRALGKDSVVKVTDSGVESVSGTLSEASDNSTSLLAGVSNRFAKAQRYTTVRRSVDKKKKLKLKTIKEIVISNKYPDIVWDNLGSEYSYRVILDGKSTDVAASEDKMVRHKVTGLSEGTHTLKVEVLKDGEVVYTPKKDSSVQWLSDAEMAKVEEGLAEVTKVAPDNDFFVAYYLNEQGLTVAAMDAYRSYLAENNDDNEARPMLIEVYHQLKLKNLKKAEALIYNDSEQASL